MRKKPLECPFCENLLSKPIALRSGALDITAGICKCRAVYVLDRSGHNLGEAFMDALVFACNGDYDKALSLMPEEYETHTFEYDCNMNTACPGGDTISKTPKLFFIKLKKPS